MNKIDKEMIKCPECGAENHVTIWNSIDSNVDLFAKKELMNGDLFRRVCDGCGCTFNVFFELMYQDVNHNVIIYLVKQDDVNETIDMLNKANAKMQIPTNGVRSRVVCTLNDLREKVNIFENNLNDKVIEIIKLLYLTNITDNNPHLKIEDVRFIVQDGKYILQFFGNESADIEITKEFYDDVEKEYENEIRHKKKSYVIDREWAIDALMS